MRLDLPYLHQTLGYSQIPVNYEEEKYLVQMLEEPIDITSSMITTDYSNHPIKFNITGMILSGMTSANQIPIVGKGTMVVLVEADHPAIDGEYQLYLMETGRIVKLDNITNNKYHNILVSATDSIRKTLH
ncbi:hypothetical protein CEW46_27540 [Bacillus cereus]|nr:hypothetical protein CEW46_27540 [Bacillus cereus]